MHRNHETCKAMAVGLATMLTWVVLAIGYGHAAGAATPNGLAEYEQNYLAFQSALDLYLGSIHEPEPEAVYMPIDVPDAAVQVADGLMVTVDENPPTTFDGLHGTTGTGGAAEVDRPIRDIDRRFLNCETAQVGHFVTLVAASLEPASVEARLADGTCVVLP